MSQSRSIDKILESKDPAIHIDDIEHALFTRDGGMQSIRKYIYDYAFEAETEAFLDKDFTFFGISSLEAQIATLASRAAPLELVESYVRKSYARKEKHLASTLMQAIIKAIKDGDVTLRKSDGSEVNKGEGMADRLIKLYKELFPDTFMQCLNQVKETARCLVDEKEIAARDAHLIVVNQVFSAIIKNDANTAEAIKNFKDFAKETTILNRLHLLSVAFSVLGKRLEEIPLKEGEMPTHPHFRMLAHRYCYEVIGSALEMDLPARIRQLVKIGVFYLFNWSQPAERQLDFKELFLNDRRWTHVHHKLGKNCFYADTGVTEVPPPAWSCNNSYALFQDLLRAISSALKFYTNSANYTLSEPMLDIEEVLNSAVVTCNIL
ncbi:MAG: hypothetical protein ACYCQI_08295 [Gammaproteobacteria bacterium]